MKLGINGQVDGSDSPVSKPTCQEQCLKAINTDRYLMADTERLDPGGRAEAEIERQVPAYVRRCKPS